MTPKQVEAAAQLLSERTFLKQAIETVGRKQWRDHDDAEPIASMYWQGGILPGVYFTKEDTLGILNEKLTRAEAALGQLGVKLT